MLTKQIYDERELLLRIAEGDERAFAVLFDRYRLPIYMHVLSILKSPARAEEITQDIFLKIWNKRQGLSEILSFENYLYIITRNYTISDLRKKFRGGGLTPDPGSGWTPEQQLQFKELNGRLGKIVDRLPPRRKQVFIMSRLEDKTHQQIASELGISTGTVNQQLIAALSFVRAELRNHPDLTVLMFIHAIVHF